MRSCCALVALVALKVPGIFWDVHRQYHLLERLAEGVGSNSGHYSFAEK